MCRLGGQRIASRSARAARARWECSAFHASPSSATVRVWPCGTKTGSNPKPSAPAGAVAIEPREHAGAAALLPVGRERDELAHVVRAPVVDAVERGEDLLDVPPLCPARGLHPRPFTERRHLDPRVVRQHPAVGRAREPPVERLDPRVVDVGRAVLRGEVPTRQLIELPAGEERIELLQLVRVR